MEIKLNKRQYSVLIPHAHLLIQYTLDIPIRLGCGVLEPPFRGSVGTQIICLKFTSQVLCYDLQQRVISLE